jgi:hypothetical protein
LPRETPGITMPKTGPTAAAGGSARSTGIREVGAAPKQLQTARSSPL